MQHDIERPFGTGEQLVGADLDTVYDRIDEKYDRCNPARVPSQLIAPDSTLSRQVFDENILGPAYFEPNRLSHREA